MTNNGTTGTVTGLSPATINYTNAGTDSMTVDASNAGGNTFDVIGTLVNPSVPNTLTTLNKGTGSDNSVTVYGTNAGSVLDLTGGAGDGSDTVDLIESSPPTILGTVNMDEVPGSTNLVINLTNDGLSHDFVLYGNGTTSTLHDDEGNFPDLTYPTDALTSLTIDTDPAFAQTLNIDMGGVMPGDGNPIPTIAACRALIFNADGDGVDRHSPAGTHALNIFGELASGPFASETHNANDQSVFPQVGQYGSIYFTDAAAVNTRSRLHRLAADHRHDPGDELHLQRLRLSRSVVQRPPTAPRRRLRTRSSSPARRRRLSPTNFETTDIANKVNVDASTRHRSTPGVPGLRHHRHGQRPGRLNRTALAHVQHSHRRR